MSDDDDIFAAAAAGDAEKVRQLLREGVDPSPRSRRHGPPLHVAAWKGHIEVAQVLLEAGVDVNSLGDPPWGTTPLYEAAAGGHIGMMRLLLERGADPTARPRGGASALERAATEDRHDVAELLLEYGAEYSLEIAAALGDAERVAELLDAGVDPEGTGRSRWLPPPLHAAAARGHA